MDNTRFAASVSAAGAPRSLFDSDVPSSSTVAAAAAASPASEAPSAAGLPWERTTKAPGAVDPSPLPSAPATPKAAAAQSAPASLSKRPTLMVLDGHSLLYRAFHALPETMTTSDGHPTNATYGFATMLAKLLGDHRPSGLAVAWDSPVATWRHEVDPAYKAGRSSTPTTLPRQIGDVQRLISTLGYRSFAVPRYEADDIVATFADRASRQGWDALLVTGDRDCFQLSAAPGSSPDREGGVTVLWTRRGVSDLVRMTPAAVEEKFGVPPSLYPQFAALRGDSSDNLPGVKGVGPKTAAKLLCDYGSIDGIYDNLDALTPKLAENLQAARERLALNLGMTILDRNVPDLPDSVSELSQRHCTPAHLHEFLAAYEMGSLYRRFPDHIWSAAA